MKGSSTVVPLSSLIARWTADGAITAEQAALLGTEGDRPVAVDHHNPSAHRRSMVIEALGYLGGVIVLVGSVLIGARYWAELATDWRLVLMGGTVLVLMTAGAMVPLRLGRVGARLRSVLWLASTAAASGFVAVVAQDVLALDGEDAPAFIGWLTAGHAALLWSRHRTPVQQVAMMLTLGTALTASLNWIDVSPDLVGLGAWMVGVGWAVLGWSGLLSPRRLALVLGAGLALLAAAFTGGTDAGLWLGVMTTCAVIGTSIVVRDLALLGVGTLGALVTVPMAMTTWFPDSVAAAFALVVLGGSLVAVALWMVRRSGA